MNGTVKQFVTDRGFGQIIGQNTTLLKVFDLIERVAASDANILIQGESGTGKELIAIARLDAAHAGEAVGRASVEQARDSRRIIRDRYEAGLTDMASLLRAAEAVAEAEARQTASQVAVMTETAALERALGRR